MAQLAEKVFLCGLGVKKDQGMTRNGIFGFGCLTNGTKALFCLVFDSHSSFFDTKLHRSTCDRLLALKAVFFVTSFKLHLNALNILESLYIASPRL